MQLKMTIDKTIRLKQQHGIVRRDGEVRWMTSLKMALQTMKLDSHFVDSQIVYIIARLDNWAKLYTYNQARDLYKRGHTLPIALSSAGAHPAIQLYNLNPTSNAAHR